MSSLWSAERAANLPTDDRRAAHADFTTGLAANLRLAEALRPLADRHGATVAEVAIAWALAWLGVTGAIVGARKPHQVDGWIGAGAVRLTRADLDEIAAAISDSGAGTGPARPEPSLSERGETGPKESTRLRTGPGPCPGRARDGANAGGGSRRVTPPTAAGMSGVTAIEARRGVRLPRQPSFERRYDVCPSRSVCSVTRHSEP
ncbi:aldo/keto reductase [Streptomyces sp. NPDC007991]|uniref:aldo/keto reductase n=1 Tax=Streptomyces sp. NPDC007991 TaxID=3364803 RepID=UPI0036EB907C